MKSKTGTEKRLRTLLLILSESDFLEEKNIENLFARFSSIRNEDIENLIVYIDILKEIGAEKRELLTRNIADKIRFVSEKELKSESEPEFESDSIYIISNNTDRPFFSNKQNEKNFSVYFVLNLGGREELKRILEKFVQTRIEKSNAQEFIESNLVIPLEPDLIMSNMKNTLTDFMIWQTAYSEYYFFEKDMSRLTDSDFRKAFDSFEKRERRYGV